MLAADKIALSDVAAADGLSAARQQQIRYLVGQQLAELPALVKELVSGTVAVF
jgi:S-adenosylmethionine synthetase